MAGLTVVERARRYAAKAGPAVSGAGGHTHTLLLARALVKGFALADGDALGVLAEWNEGNAERWSPGELEHKVKSAAGGPGEVGYLLKGDAAPVGRVDDKWKARSAGPVDAKKVFDLGALERLARGGAGRADLSAVVDLPWLANRSEVDPAEVSPDVFLSGLYRRDAGERVLIFTDYRSQGDAVWPVDGIPVSGPDGVWFMCQPVDGQRHPNPRLGRMSRRSEESVLAWRYMVLESDDAPLRLWLGALARVVPRIAAVTTSGGRSVHALVRVDAKTKREWDDLKREMLALVVVGADRGALSAVRLTRLPGCLRRGKEQKLLYFAPTAPNLTLEDLLPRRDVLELWRGRVDGWAKTGAAAGGVEGLIAGCRYYARFDQSLSVAAGELEDFK